MSNDNEANEANEVNEVNEANEANEVKPEPIKPEPIKLPPPVKDANTIDEPLSSLSLKEAGEPFGTPNLSVFGLWNRSKLSTDRDDEEDEEEVYDPLSEGPRFDAPNSEWIPEEYEHKHDPNKEEFQLIPHHQDRDKWKIYLPISFWLCRYKWKEWLPYDCIAALTAIVVVIPQSMGYALVAGLQPIYGLYSALMGHSLYGPFGTSGQLIVAPVAVVSLMTKETLHPYFADKDTSDPIVRKQMAAYGSALAFQVGIISLVLGICRAGVLQNMLAEPVIAGFTFAAAILIGISQLNFIFRLDIHGEQVIQKLIDFFENIESIHGYSAALAVCCITFLLIIRFWQKSDRIPGAKYAKFIPSALILVIVTTAISYNIGSSTGWDVVGTLPRGLPKFRNFLTEIEGDDFWSLWVSSILITILSFIESIAVATKFADKHDYSVDASQELIALGICNLIGCWFQIYPVSGVLSLATVVEAAGATTPLYTIMAAIGLVFCVAFLLFLFEWLPEPTLGSIVLVGIINLIDVHKMKEIWKINRRDFICMIITILVTLFLGIDYGVALGIVASIVLFVQKAAKPHYGVLGRITTADAVVYRNVKYHPETETRKDMLMIRWDASLFFANIESFKHRIRKQIGRHLAKYEYPKHWCLVLCFSGVNEIDYTAIEGLRNFIVELKCKEQGMTLVFCKLKTQVLDAFIKSEILDIIGEDHVLWEVHQAEDWWKSRVRKNDYSPRKAPISPTLSNSKRIKALKRMRLSSLKKGDHSASLLDMNEMEPLDLNNNNNNIDDIHNNSSPLIHYAATHIIKQHSSSNDGDDDHIHHHHHHHHDGMDETDDSGYHHNEQHHHEQHHHEKEEEVVGVGIVSTPTTIKKKKVTKKDAKDKSMSVSIKHNDDQNA